MEHLIEVDSPELACFHEGGHADLALGLGVQVIESELHRGTPRSGGRMRAFGTPEDRNRVGLGGYAAEFYLHKMGRLVKPGGGRLTDKEFMDSAMNNAADDKVSYFGCDFVQQSGLWPGGLDREFMSHGATISNSFMRFQVVESIADALLIKDRLNAQEILASTGLGTPLQYCKKSLLVRVIPLGTTIPPFYGLRCVGQATPE
ncbi:hypothetical protein GCM10027285_23250 [Oleiagrimonas citrea]|uniref:Peptidase M41 domain-containing protein n=1 Tax=Oleiagrimonas citrea TaxID=1665687 RepID=A0A846ZGE4_9GAMM|nr:hypothetical protein [Oleiagrimonas citrea]NKZ37362.1 hypothetical protein [Oleiagrimonas citrea]